MNKTFYSAFTCKGNVGDLLINKYQIEEYAKHGEVYVDATGMPDDFREVLFDSQNTNIKDFVRTFGIKYRGLTMLKVLSLLKKEGFTHFTKSPGPYAHIKFPIKTLLIRLIGAWGYWQAKKNGMKVFAAGIDLNFQDERGWLRKLNQRYFSLYHLLGVRSLDNKLELSPLLENVTYLPDMAFLCPAISSAKEISVKKRIAISFRKNEYSSQIGEALKRICDIFRQQGYGIDIIYQVEEDKTMCEELARDLSDFRHNYRQKILCYKELEKYDEYDFVISNRLHVLLMGAAHQALPIALIVRNEKERKIARVFSTVFTEKMWEYVDTDVTEHIHHLISNYSTIVAKNKAEMQKQQNICRELIRKIYDN